MGIHNKVRTDYMNYIMEHIDNVRKAHKEYGELLAETLRFYPEERIVLTDNIMKHDVSKFSTEEFEGYRKRFFPEYEYEQNENEFNIAWLHHIHTNPHHPEYWVLVEDNGSNVLLDMPPVYIAEMILDWIAMGYKFHNTAYAYYESSNKPNILSEKTQELVQQCMKALKEYDKSKENGNEKH